MGVIDLITKDEQIRVELLDPTTDKPTGVFVTIRRVPDNVNRRITRNNTENKFKGNARHEIVDNNAIGMDVLVYAIQEWEGVNDPLTGKPAEINRETIGRLALGYRAQLLEACIGSGSDQAPDKDDVENFSDTPVSGSSGQE